MTAALLLIACIPAGSSADAASKSSVERNDKGEIVHTVKNGESLSDIAIEYGVPLEDLKNKNDVSAASTGDKLVMPATLKSTEKDLMARLVQAEAKGECYEGKVGVATVVLNRVESKKFPNTVSEVIYAKKQFTPVSNKEINKPAGAEAKKAVNEAIAKIDSSMEATFFYNPKLTSDKWIKSLKVLKIIGNHNFAVS